MLAPQIAAGKNKDFDGNDGDRATVAGMVGWGAGCPSTCMAIAPQIPPNQTEGGADPSQLRSLQGFGVGKVSPFLPREKKKTNNKNNNQEIEKERTLRLIHPRKKLFL